MGFLSGILANQHLPKTANFQRLSEKLTSEDIGVNVL